jgi:PelA/Pel-15E family pectate lyase
MKFNSLLLTAFALTFATSTNTFAAIIGTNIPAKPLTAERVAALPAWKNYLENSVRQRQADQNFLHAEMKALHLTNAIAPPKSSSPKGTPLDRTASWYGGDEARHIAENVITFQTPAGGWSKHTDFTQHRRAPGELFAGDSNSRFIITNDFDQPADVSWSYIGTFDNGATITELRFLAKVITAGKTNTAALEKSFARGLEYIFAAQFPNGGWPQVWPLQGGYHDDVTFNDDAMLNVIRLVRDVSLGEKEFAFVPAELRAQADAVWKRGLDCILAAQITAHGQRTAWGQQHDALTLQPSSARNYEMPSAASSESATLVLFLMQLPNPDSNAVAAVHAAVAWFGKTKIEGKSFQVVGSESRKLVDAPGAGPIWARYYELGTDRPIYGDRDLTIHDDVNEISRERRKGYGWFKDSAKRVEQHYAKWAKAHPLQKN